MTTSMTISEAVGAALLCLYAISTSRNADTAALGTGEQRYGARLARAEAAYRSAEAACESEQPALRDFCFRRAKAAYIGDIVEANAGANAGHRSD